jgi:hypothetical protein
MRDRSPTTVTRRFALGACLMALLHGGTVRAQGDPKTDAINAIPFDKLTPEATQKIVAVLERATLFRRVPTQVVNCDNEMFLHCLRSPEVIINIWQLMGITTIQAKRTGDFTWTGTDGAGTTGDVEMIYGSDQQHILFANGFYEGPLFKRKMPGRAVMVVYSEPTVGRDQMSLVTCRMDLFMQLDNAGADLMAKTLYPMIGKTADANFAETASFIAKISQSAERNGPGMQQLANKLQNVKPHIREEFAKTAAVVNQRAAARSYAVNEPPVVRSQSPAEMGLRPSNTAAIPGSKIPRQ